MVITAFADPIVDVFEKAPHAGASWVRFTSALRTQHPQRLCVQGMQRLSPAASRRHSRDGRHSLRQPGHFPTAA
jgi:hypothetical protein